MTSSTTTLPPSLPQPLDPRDPADDPETLLASLEAEDDSAPYRAARIQALRSELASSTSTSSTQQQTNDDHFYKTLTSDQEVLEFTTTNPKAVLHFFHDGFARCAVMDGHLRILAGLHAHTDVKWGRVDVGRAPFVVERLKVRVLPVVVGFLGGVEKGRVVGFEGLDGLVPVDEKAKRVTEGLEKWLLGVGVLVGGRRLGKGEGDGGSEDDEEVVKEEGGGRRRGIRQAKKKVDDDEDDDWD